MFDQNACTAPHLIVWLGDRENVEKSKTVFWSALYKLVKQKYKEIQAVVAVDKLTTLYSQSIYLSNIRKMDTENNLLWRIDLDSLPTNIDEFRCSCGYFSECHLQSLSELSNIVNRKYQTLAYYGISKEKITDFVETLRPLGIDRIVSIGHTTDFSLIWDGYDLIEMLSRKILIL